MITKSWKVYGMDGHRQRQSFGASECLDLINGPYARNIQIAIEREDITGTNDCVIIRVTGENAESCVSEFNRQLDDGIFENCRYGKIEEI